MRLLFILPEYYPHTGGGIATFYQVFLPLLVKEGHDVTVIIGSGVVNGTTDIIHEGVKIVELQPKFIAKYQYAFERFAIFPELHKQLIAAWAMYAQMQELASFDIVECCDWGLGFVPWIVEKHKHATKILVQLHGSIGQIEYEDPRQGLELMHDVVRMIEQKTINHSDLIITHSSSNLSYWQPFFTQKIHYQLPAYPIKSVIEQTDQEETFGLVVGRIQYWKGVFTLCEAMRILKDELHEKTPIIKWLGRDVSYLNAHQSTKTYLEANYADVWGSYIIPIGTLPNEETLQLMKKAHFGLVPSEWDVFNLTVAEWLSLEKVLICSTGAGAVDLIEHEQNGFSFEKGNAQQLAQQIKNVIQLDFFKKNQMQQNAIHTIKNKLNPLQFTQERIVLYQQLQKESADTALDKWTQTMLSPQENSNPIDAMLAQHPIKRVLIPTLKRIKNKFK